MGNENYDVFSAAMMRDWMNALIANQEQRKLLDKLNSQIETVPTADYIQIYSGIEILADVLGLGLTEDSEGAEPYHRYCFIYRNVKFLQLSEKRIIK